MKLSAPSSMKHISLEVLLLKKKIRCGKSQVVFFSKKSFHSISEADNFRNWSFFPRKKIGNQLEKINSKSIGNKMEAQKQMTDVDSMGSNSSSMNGKNKIAESTLHKKIKIKNCCTQTLHPTSIIPPPFPIFPSLECNIYKTEMASCTSLVLSRNQTLRSPHGWPKVTSPPAVLQKNTLVDLTG